MPSFAVWGGTSNPTIPAGAVDHTLLSATDWLPTVAAIAGLPLPASVASSIDGEDMSHVFLSRRSGSRPPTPRTKMVPCCCPIVTRLTRSTGSDPQRASERASERERERERERLCWRRLFDGPICDSRPSFCGRPRLRFSLQQLLHSSSRN